MDHLPTDFPKQKDHKGEDLEVDICTDTEQTLNKKDKPHLVLLLELLCLECMQLHSNLTAIYKH